MKKVAVITGAGSGLGASLAKKYAQMDYHVCMLGRSREKLIHQAEQLEGDFSIHPVDVSYKKEISSEIDGIINSFGAIDILFNCAGVIALGLAETISEESVHQMIDINLKGTIFTTQAVLPHMKSQNQGIIANVISTAGLEGKVDESVYCASKFGVRGFTEALLAELQDTPIHVYAAYMGGMNTEFWEGIFPAGQTAGLMDPDEIADILIDNLTPRRNLTVTQVTIRNKR